jgi:hypothetical protein
MEVVGYPTQARRGGIQAGFMLMLHGSSIVVHGSRRNPRQVATNPAALIT